MLLSIYVSGSCSLFISYLKCFDSCFAPIENNEPTLWIFAYFDKLQASLQLFNAVNTTANMMLPLLSLTLVSQQTHKMPVIKVGFKRWNFLIIATICDVVVWAQFYVRSPILTLSMSRKAGNHRGDGDDNSGSSRSTSKRCIFCKAYWTDYKIMKIQLFK